MSLIKTLITNSKATLNINKIIDGLTSDKDIDIANKFITTISEASQEQRDEIFKFFAKINGETKEDIQSAFIKKIQSNEVKSVLNPTSNNLNVGSKLNIIEGKPRPVNNVSDKSH